MKNPSNNTSINISEVDQAIEGELAAPKALPAAEAVGIEGVVGEGMTVGEALPEVGVGMTVGEGLQEVGVGIEEG